MSLPSNYVSIAEVLALEQTRDGLRKEIKPMSLVNVIGVVKDRREPCPTQRTDWKAAIRLIDLSTEEEGNGADLEVHMFYPEALMKAMPKARCGDVLILSNVKIQSRYGEVSVMSNRAQTKFALYTASKIPKFPGSAAPALVPFPPELQKKLEKRDTDYISHLRTHISEDSVPQEEAFIQMAAQSKNFKEKFRELKDVSHDSYCDLLVQVVKKPFEGGIATTLWVSDYTSNPEFYHFSGTDSGTQKDEAAVGKCPRGQMSMQISCFDEHMMHIQEAGITKGTWVSIRNARIRYGQTGSNLEGFMRGSQGDPRNVGKPIKITALHVEDREDLTPRHKAALERLRDYLRAEKTKNQLLEEAASAGRKRKANDETAQPTGNSKTKRQAKRAAAKKLKRAEQEASKQGFAETETTEDEAAPQQGVLVHADAAMSTSSAIDVQGQLKQMTKTSAPPNLNASVKCENHMDPTKTVAMVTQKLTSVYDVGNNEPIPLSLPFVNRKYRIDVRVRDFFPPNLKDFVQRKRIRRNAVGVDLLSNDGGSEVNFSGDDADGGDESDLWEWCFWLQLEDASPDVKPKLSFWVLVDNLSGQCLTNLDAENLGENEVLLRKLRENLFILWGDLEDQKPAMDAARTRGANKRNKKRGGEAPPPHSDGEGDDDGLEVKVSNKPFSCCVEQYGVKVPEDNSENADAGERRRWERVFKLFGTRIV